MAARSIWKGAISFGLVNIPIEVFSAVQKRRLYFILINYAKMVTRLKIESGVL